MGKSPSQFRFHKNDTIGAPAAEDDAEFLDSCFVETGDLELLADVNDRRIIVLGRTGTGKTALLRQLAKAAPGTAICLSPENLALTYIANSSVLNFFSALGINLDPFYKLLWRHIFTVEVLRRFFESPGESSSESFLVRLRRFFAGPSREDKEISQAITYLEKWGSSFWNETEYRVKEITQKVEKALETAAKAALGAHGASLTLNHNAAVKLSEEQKTEVIHRAQEVVARAQVEDLHQVTSVLATVLASRDRAYFVIVDRLDENWVEERLRYKLLMGLILTAREFIPVPNVKIVLGFRRDLIDRVFRLSRDSGFQEEKYRGLYLPLQWTKSQIHELLDRRVRRMVERRYTKQPVSYADLLPAQVKGREIGEFIFSVANRPRDVIAFFNVCVHAAVDRSKLTAPELAKAMGEYSQSRLRALADEWHADYPFLLDFARIFRERPASFKLSDIAETDVENLCLEVVADSLDGKGLLFEQARAVLDGIISPQQFKIDMFHVFYRTGLVGLKISPDTAVSWSDDTGHAVPSGQISDAAGVTVAAKYALAVGSRVA